MPEQPKKSAYTSTTKHFNTTTSTRVDEEVNPWTEDEIWGVKPSSFKVISGPSVAARRRRKTPYPTHFNKYQARSKFLPMNWLQLVNLFMAVLAILLFAKLLSLVFI